MSGKLFGPPASPANSRSFEEGETTSALRSPRAALRMGWTTDATEVAARRPNLTSDRAEAPMAAPSLKPRDASDRQSARAGQVERGHELRDQLVRRGRLNVSSAACRSRRRVDEPKDAAAAQTLKDAEDRDAPRVPLPASSPAKRAAAAARSSISSPARACGRPQPPGKSGPPTAVGHPPEHVQRAAASAALRRAAAAAVVGGGQPRCGAVVTFNGIRRRRRRRVRRRRRRGVSSRIFSRAAPPWAARPRRANGGRHRRAREGANCGFDVAFGTCVLTAAAAGKTVAFEKKAPRSQKRCRASCARRRRAGWPCERCCRRGAAREGSGPGRLGGESAVLGAAECMASANGRRARRARL